MVRHRSESGIEFPSAAGDVVPVQAHRMSVGSLPQIFQEASRDFLRVSSLVVTVVEYNRQGSGLSECIPVFVYESLNFHHCIFLLPYVCPAVI